jgi:hypothetical protein
MKNPLSDLTDCDTAIVADLRARICFLDSAAGGVLPIDDGFTPPGEPISVTRAWIVQQSLADVRFAPKAAV